MAVDANIVNFVFYLVFDSGITPCRRNVHILPRGSTAEIKLQEWCGV